VSCERLRGVDDVGGGEAVVQPAGVGADAFGDGGGEGDDVVADFGFDGVDAYEEHNKCRHLSPDAKALSLV
jgi:hypothetical protein